MFLLLFCKLYPSELYTKFYRPESTSRAYLEFQRQDVCGRYFSQVFLSAYMPIGLYISCHSKSIVLSYIQMEQIDIHCKSCNNTKTLLDFRPYMKASFLLRLFLFPLLYGSSDNLPSS